MGKIVKKCCEWCKAEFEYRKRDDKPDRKFCGNKCKFEYQKILPPILKSGEVKMCPVCNNEFYTQRNENYYMCCSAKCAAIHKIGKPIFKTRNRVTLHCCNCNKSVDVMKYREKTFRFCSNLCRAEYKCKTGTANLPNFNPKACQFIDEYGKKYGYNFRHALNKGEYYITELGYYLDGYDEEKNTVIEFDEEHHYINGILRKRDLVRQQKIKDLLRCKFIRITESKWENL